MAYDLELGTYTLAKADVIQPPSNDSKQVRQSSKDLERAEFLFSRVKAYLPFIDVICVEVPHGSQNARASLGAGASIGLIAALRHITDKPVICVNAGETRMEITGKISATKQQAISWAIALYGSDHFPKHAGKVVASKAEHIADAIAAVHAGSRTETFKMLVMLANKDK